MPKENPDQFQGSQISRIPSSPGLYAWYYKPLVFDENTITKTLSSFLETPTEISTEIQMRYGLRLVARAPLKAEFGSQGQSALEILDQAVDQADKFFVDFFRSNAVQNFSRPIYIGIAKNLNIRVYNQHYLSLSDMYDMSSPVSRFLSIYPDASVQDVMERLSLPHSFALEARSRNISPRDLTAHIYTTDALPSDIGFDTDDPGLDTPARRALERLLQIVADPICGRR